MGRVYLAVQPAIGSRVAIKVLSDECARDPGLLDRFFAEARAVNLIRHENIVSVIDLAVLPDGRPYIIMEFIEGETLSRAVRGTQAPIGGVIQVIAEVLSALEAAHAIGIVHRDLKPDNIMITGKGHAKVLDFGIAKLAPGLQRERSPRTRTGAVLGTPPYMAPEQIKGENVDPRTDVYAAGIVLYEAVTGRRPFTHSNAFDLMRAHLEEAPPRPSMIRPDLPISIEHVILIALAKDASQRFQSAAAMGQALQAASRDLGFDQWRTLSSGSTPLIPLTPELRRAHSPSRESTPATRNIRPAATVVDPPPAVTKPMPMETPPPAAASRLGRRGLAIAAVVLVVGVGGLVIGRMSTGTSAITPTVSTTPTTPARAGALDAGPPGVARVDAPVTADVSAPPHAPGARGTAHPPSTSRSPALPTPSPHTDVPPDAAEQHVEVSRALPAPPAGGGPVRRVPPNSPGCVNGPPPDATGKPVFDCDGRPLTTLVTRSDYDTKHFDPVAYIARAQQLARVLAPDAKFVDFEINQMYPDGRLELHDENPSTYRFLSASGDQDSCEIEIKLLHQGVKTQFNFHSPCMWKLGPTRARCSIADVFRKADVVRGAPATGPAQIVFSGRGWDYQGKGGYSVDDDCSAAVR